MEVAYERCGGLDVGKDEIVACVRVPDGSGGRRQQVRTYPTFTSGLEALAGWLTAEGVTDVVMEATGQYWKPVWYLLEEHGFMLMLVNARHVKILPGRKTDLLTELASPFGSCFRGRGGGGATVPARDHRGRVAA